MLISVRAYRITRSSKMVAAAALRSVLLIMADDLRPELGAYGCEHMHTPSLDAFAAEPETVVFDRAYVSVAWWVPTQS